MKIARSAQRAAAPDKGWGQERGQVHLNCSAATNKAVSGIYLSRARLQCRVRGLWSAIATVAVELPPDAVPTISSPGKALNGDYTVSWSAPGGGVTVRPDAPGDRGLGR